ncbi:MAG: PHP domain-containing protein, partial [bacterium]|nr:PHP domain-containing protein [bacterium]
PPELRENTGEIEAAAKGALPKLIENTDIKGNLHLHTTWSGDGSASPVEMLHAARANGFSYVAITDHASSMGMVKGIKSENIKEYIASIRAAEKKVGGIHALAGAEVDIEEDGSLYLSDKELSQLDWVVASIHSYFKQSKAEATKRLIRAIENPYVKCIGHATTRVVGKRPPMEFDWAPLFAAAKKHGVVFEVNASHRMDLSDVLCRQAKAAGVKLCLDSDGHSIEEFDLALGIGVARRGWLEKNDVVNTKTWSEFSKLL